MNKQIELLDCTLRDGAYIVDADFGASTIRGIINRLQNAGVNLIECGWLKNEPHKYGTSFYHVPIDLCQYLTFPKSQSSTYVAMIDYNRYDLSILPECDGKSINAIRVVFPRDKVDEGLALVDPIRAKGYRVFVQAANTLGYTDAELLSLIEKVNKVHPEGMSIVDTFGAMYEEDLIRIVSLVLHNLDSDIKIGFHGHNNLQMAFALAQQFVNITAQKERSIMIDSSLCGMGRGAGNANTELVADFLNKKHKTSYNLDVIMDAIDIYMSKFQENYKWGYSIPFFVAGSFCSHVNNIDYLQKNHKIKYKDMKKIIEMVSPNDRLTYNYDNLENKYIEYMNRKIDDTRTIKFLKEELEHRNVVIIAPGKSSIDKQDLVKKEIEKNNAVVIGVNAVLPEYKYNYLFFSSTMRYEYAKETYPVVFKETPAIVTANVDIESSANSYKINYNDYIKYGWKYFENSTIICLRILDSLNVSAITVAGLDGFYEKQNYTDENLQSMNMSDERAEFNKDLFSMLEDYYRTRRNQVPFNTITSDESIIKL